MKKTFLLPVFILCLVSGKTSGLERVWPEGNWLEIADTAWYTSHPENTTFTVSTAQELAGLAVLVDQGHTFRDTTIVLSQDLNLGSRYWSPIGNTKQLPTGVFCGIFDGKGKTIRNLSIYTKQEGYYEGNLFPGPCNHQNAGLFGCVGGKVTLKNLTLEGGEIRGIKLLNGSACVGALAGKVECRQEGDSICISNCHVKDMSIYGSEPFGWIYAGGLVGYLFTQGKSVITGCSNNSIVHSSYNPSPHTSYGQETLGGIVGQIDGPVHISLCRDDGGIGYVYRNGATGGIVGWLSIQRQPCVIASCYVTGCGIVGGVSCEDSNGLTLSGCYNYGSSAYYRPRYIAETYGDGGIVCGILFNTETGTPEITLEDCYALHIFRSGGYIQYPLVGYLQNNFPGKVSISNCLALYESSNVPAHRLINQRNNPVSLSGNYTLISGVPMGANDADGLDGGEWSGRMADAPVNLWNPDVWEVDETDRYMPLLKGFDNQTKVENPFYGISQAFHTVTFPEVEGVVISYAKGTYKVRKGTGLTFTVSRKSGYEVKKMKVTDQDGIPLIGLPNFSGIYKIEKISKDITVVISGVVVGNEIVENDAPKVWSSGGTIRIWSDDVQTIRIYTYSGQLYKQLTLQPGETAITVPQGIYIVQTEKAVRKVIVREN